MLWKPGKVITVTSGIFKANTFLDERIFLTDRGTMQNNPGFMLIVHFSNQLRYKEVAFKVRMLHI